MAKSLAEQAMAAGMSDDDMGDDGDDGEDPGEQYQNACHDMMKAFESGDVEALMDAFGTAVNLAVG